MRRIGIIGLDTSHAPEFARYFNAGPGKLEGRVVAAWPGGSNDAPLSADRVKGFTAEVRDQYGVKIFATPEEVAAASDALLLLSMDGRIHAELFERTAPAGLPTFINKPLATRFTDVERIAGAARRHGVTWFSASSVRYAVDASWPAPQRLEITCPLWFEPANPGWFWYGVHGVELMSQLLPVGITHVRVTTTSRTEVLTVRRIDDREIRIDGLLSRDAPFTIARDGESPHSLAVTMEVLAKRVADFFAGGAAPVSIMQMSEVVRTLEAANASRAQGGMEIALSS